MGLAVQVHFFCFYVYMGCFLVLAVPVRSRIKRSYDNDFYRRADNYYGSASYDSGYAYGGGYSNGYEGDYEGGNNHGGGYGGRHGGGYGGGYGGNDYGYAGYGDSGAAEALVISEILDDDRPSIRVPFGAFGGEGGGGGGDGGFGAAGPLIAGAGLLGSGALGGNLFGNLFG